MADEQNAKPTSPTGIARIVCIAQWQLLQPIVAMSLLALAMVEALLSPFLGWHLALASLATAAVAIGLILAHGALGIQTLGSWAAGIYQRLDSFCGQEKSSESQRRAAPEPLTPPWKM